MKDNLTNSKRIAQNTLLLYFRMLFIMAVSLYTSRIVLNTLGIEDFGIYNVVGGIVFMFSMLSGSLSSAITRFIAFELGRGDKNKLYNIFSASVTIQIGISLLIIILAETIGLWFLNVKMNIAEERMTAANWVYQFSIFTFTISLISIPYNASIIAHEKMSAFAYISLIEVLAKLLIVYLLLISPIDKLIFYAILMFCVAIIIRLAYGIYCKKHFEECTYHFTFDKILLKQMFGFAGWNFIGATSAVLRDHGGNIIINMFCGPTVNAARGIAFQVNTAIHGFVSNFMTALNPQITKSYASGEHNYMITLIYQGARLSFYMLLILSLPVLINTHYILVLWLKMVPEHTVSFVQLVLLLGMSEALSQPLITATLATGKIRNYQIIVGGLQMMNLPVSYYLLKNGIFPEAVIIVAIFFSQICLATRLIMLHYMISLSIKKYIKKVYLNVSIVALISSIIPIFMKYSMPESLVSFVTISIASIIYTGLIIYFIGCTNKERHFLNRKLNYLITKIKKSR